MANAVSDEPSFYTLFRRSRYARGESDDHTVGSRQNRRELYAVAAVAFAIKHDDSFRCHFLSAVCGIAPHSNDALTLAVQPFDHSDFSMKDAGGVWLVVVEFKIGAALEDKQNPAKTQAFFAVDGYGTLILGEPEYQVFTRRLYVVMDDTKHFDDATKHGIECKSRTWVELASGIESGLWSDLLHSLGDLGIAAFQLGKLKNMNNASYTRQAVAMHQTLVAIASKLKVRSSGKMDINMEGDNAWYGREFTLDRLMNHIYLRALAGSDSRGWFGYQARADQWELAVWLYCESEEAARRTRDYIEPMLKQNLLGRLSCNGKDVTFVSEMVSHIGDAEWFEAVFKALQDKAISR